MAGDDLSILEDNWHKACRLYARREYSAAILRAATAVELVLNYAIRQQLVHKKKLPPQLVDYLFQRHQGPAQKFELYRKLMVRSQRLVKIDSLKGPLETVISFHRNAISHRGEFKGPNEACAALQECYSVLSLLVGFYKPRYRMQKFDPNAPPSSETYMLPGFGVVTHPGLPKSDKD